ncbi:MAG: hypothetical protein ICV72_04785 [Aldersonia sp.]|nr:hypothetical protein [Aldersonia sp.]
MVHNLLLIIHIVAGTAGLVLGPLAMRHDRRRFAAGDRFCGPINAGYQATVLAVCLSAVALVVLYRPELWWLIPLSVLTYGLALLARESAARRFRGWTHGYVHGLGGSYIALVTALIVVSLTVDGPVTGPAQLIVWLTPTAIGTALIELWRRRLVNAISLGTGAAKPTRQPSA